MSSDNASSNRLLSHDDIRFYANEGYLISRGLFSAREVADLACEAEHVFRAGAELMNVNNMRVRFKPHHLKQHAVFEVFDPIADLSPVASAITRDRRILDRLHELYGEPAELFKDKLIYKLPGAAGATLHQDWIAWPGFPESFLTVLVAIDAFTEDNGATEVFPRVHKKGYLSAKDGQHHYVEITDLDAKPVPLLLAPGDVAIFSCFTPHRSGPNRSLLPRRGYFISYNARSDGGDQYARHYREFHEYLRAKAPVEQRPLMFFR